MDALCWVFGSRAHALRTERSSQLINDRSRMEGNQEVYVLFWPVNHRKVEVQFILTDAPSIPAGFSPQDVFCSLSSLPEGSETLRITVGRRLRNRSLEYFGRLNQGSSFPLKYSEICVLLESLAIQVNLRGKFIIQQSELLTNLRQSKTYLLEMIEECAGNGKLVTQIEELLKKRANLITQKESVSNHLEEMKQYCEEHHSELELAERVKETEEKAELLKREEEDMVSRERGLRRIVLLRLDEEFPARMEGLKAKLESIDGELNGIWKEKNEKEAILSEKEKEKRAVEKRLDQKQAEFNRISSERKRLKRELMQEQEKLLFTLEKKKEVRSQLEEQSKQQQEMIESLNCSEEELPSMIEMYKSMKRQQRNAKEIEELEKREIDLEQAIETQTKATEAKTIRWNEIRSIQHRLREMYDFASSIALNKSPPSHSKPFIPPFLKEMQRILDSIHSDAIRGPLAFLPIRVTHSTFILPASIAIQHALTTTIIVENRETAILVADTFKREQGGVITCLILSELNQSSVKYPTIPHTRPLVEAIQCAEEYRPLIQKLFGRWLLVENDDAAIRVQRELNGWDCVTMDGIVYSAKGEVRQVEEKLEMEGKREK